MTKHAISGKSLLILLVALLCAAGTWLYATRVMIAKQVADAKARGSPRGNFSDLYPSWVGARELLLHGRNPYSEEVTRTIQTGYYGRPLDPTRREDPRDQQRFVYPVYEVLVVAPTLDLPFPVVRRIFFWLLTVLTAASVWAWFGVLRWPASAVAQIAAITFTLGSVAAMQGLELQQISLLVAGLLAFAILLVSRGHALAAGVLLGLACMKPQLVIWVLVWLGIWTLSDLRGRYRWAASFLLTLGLLLGVSEWWLPHWISSFWEQARAYYHYADAVGILELMTGPVLGRLLELVALAAMLGICWRGRHRAASTGEFAFTAATVLAVTALLVPKCAPYNQVLLMPALLALVHRWAVLWREGRPGRLLLAATAVMAWWIWIACIALAGLSFILPQETVERYWTVPGWTLLGFPLGVAAVMLVYAWRLPFAASAEAARP